jgi:hypothetical protein
MQIRTNPTLAEQSRRFVVIPTTEDAAIRTNLPTPEGDQRVLLDPGNSKDG